MKNPMNTLLDLPGKSQVIVTPLGTNDRMVTVTTPCCGASAKGIAGFESGVGCRSCYAQIPAAYGWAAVESDSDGVIAEGLTSVIIEVFPSEIVANILAVNAVRNLRVRS